MIDRKGAHIKEVSKKLSLLRDRYVTLLKKSDGEDALKQVIPKAAGKVGLPCEPVPLERHESNGRAEQKKRDICTTCCKF